MFVLLLLFVVLVLLVLCVMFVLCAADAVRATCAYYAIVTAICTAILLMQTGLVCCLC